MSKGTTKLGFINPNQQINLGCLDIPGTDHGQKLYHMKCNKCLHEYGANGSDIHLRKGPQGGQPSSGGWVGGGNRIGTWHLALGTRGRKGPMGRVGRWGRWGDGADGRWAMGDGRWAMGGWADGRMGGWG